MFPLGPSSDYPIGTPSSGSPNLIFAQQAINAAWTYGATAANGFETITESAVNLIAAQSEADALTVDTANTDAVIEPPVTIPTDVSPGNVMSLFDTKSQELIATLAEKFTIFQGAYFPDDNAVYAQAETWVSQAISNPDQAIPASVAAQFLTDVKSRAYADATVQSDAVLATFAARRFPLPTGAAASAVLQVNQKAQDSISEAGRKLMMGYIDQMKYAVDKALSMRQEAMSSAVAYITALVSAPNIASSLVGIGYDAQSKMVSAASSFYGARIEASRLVKQAEQFNVNAKFAKDEKNVANDITLLQEQVKLLLTEAQALAQIATALFNNLHASANVNAAA